MRIAIVAPLFETVPPQKYGGTERVVYMIIEELVRLGHTVTLYAAGGCQTSAKLIECVPRCFRELDIDDSSEEFRSAYTAQLQLALSALHEHDIVHVHHATYPFHLPVLEANRTLPIVWTDHNAIDDDVKPAIFDSMAKLGIGLTGLSDSYRNTVPDANWLATIHHGLPANLLTPSNVPPAYLAFLGRIAPEKGIKAAVGISEAAGYELKVAAKVDVANLAFYDTEIKPLFARSNVDFIGEINEKEKGPFLSGAIALVFPICWKEPFGLVMIEAMACGCPTVAFRMGSVPEIIEHGVTGFVVDTEEEAVEALRHVGTLDRRLIRQRFEERFTATAMTKKYVEVYEKVIQQATVKEEAKQLMKSKNTQQDEEPGTMPDVSIASHQRASILAALQRASPCEGALAQNFLRRPPLSRQVSTRLYSRAFGAVQIPSSQLS